MTKLKQYISDNGGQIVLLLAFFSIWMVLQNCFLNEMRHFVSHVISQWNQVWFIGVVIGLSCLWCGVLIFRHIKYDYVPSQNILFLLIFLCAVYGYYRFIGKQFVFWGIGCFAWLDLLFLILGLYIFCEVRGGVLSQKRIKKLNENEQYLLRDDAITSIEEDLFGYQNVVNDLSSQLESVDLSQHAYSVGLAGEWGIGKSSMLNLLVEKQKEKGNIVVFFHPRRAKAVDKIAEDFFSVFAHELGKYDGRCDVLISKYAHSLQLDGKLKWLNSVFNTFSDWTSENRKQGVNIALQNIGRRVFVVVEDFDRLTAQEILEVLKIIDAYGNFCNTIFITAYDKTCVNEVLNTALGYKEGKSFFTDKYFQYEYPMKEQTIDGINYFVQKYIYQWAIDQQATEAKKMIINEEWSRVYQFLRGALTTLRAWKRYTNLLRCSYAKVKDNVNFSDFALVTLIRYLDNGAYVDLYKKKYITYANQIFDDTNTNVLTDNVKEMVGRYTLIPGLNNMLQFMFSPYEFRSKSMYGRIQREESFYNYFIDQNNGKLYYGDIEDLIKKPSLKDTIALFDRYINLNEDNRKSIEEYLFSRLPNDILTEERLRRYVNILVYGYSVCQNVNYVHRIYHYMTEDIAQQFVNAGIVWEKERYVEVVKEGLQDMYEYCPSFINFIMRDRIRERKKNDKFDEICIETIEEDVFVAEQTQKRYDELYGTERWNAKTSIANSQISIAPNKSLTQNASTQILKMMFDYREEYARQLIEIETPTYSRNYSVVSIWSYNSVRSIIGRIEDFTEWINGVQNQDVKFILLTLHEEAQQTNEANLQTSCISEDKWEDYKYIADRIREIKDG